MKNQFSFSENKKTVAKNYSALVILQALNYLLPLIILPFLEQRLGLERFGLVMKAQYLIVFCSVATDFGFNLTATREIALLKSKGEDYSFVFFKVFWAKVVLLIMVFAILMIVVFSSEGFSENWKVYLLSYGVVVGQMLFPVWFFQGIEKMRLITVINILAKVIFTVLLFIFISKSSDYLLVPVFNSIGFIVAGLISFLISLKYVTWQTPNFKGSKTFYLESFQIFGSNLASQIGVAANGLILGIFAGDSLVGIYSVFEKLILAAKNMFVPIYQSLYPLMSRKDETARRRMLHKLIPVVASIGIIGYLLLFFYGEWFIDYWFSDPRFVKYASLLDIMGLIIVLSGLNMLFLSLYFPANKQYGVRLKLLTGVALLTIILNIAFVPQYGLPGTIYVFTSIEAVMLVSTIIIYLSYLTVKSQNNG